MPAEAHHREALIETAREELTRAHRAAAATEAGEMRRGLTLGLAALREAAAVEPPLADLSGLADDVATALADLDNGKLAEMEQLVESVRTRLDALPG